MKMKLLLSVSLVASMALASVPALASPNFPSEIVKDVGSTCPPADCTLCHASSAGGGKPTTPFGIALVGFGLVPNDTTSLQNALTKMEAAKTDSNNNGIADIDELKACRDPSSGASTVGYGCSSTGNASGVLWVGIAALAGLVFGRRRRTT